MIRRFLAAMLVLFMVLVLLPEGALASPDGTLYIGDTDVTPAEEDRIYYWVESSGDTSYEIGGDAGDYAFSVFVDSKDEIPTMTLNGVSINSLHQEGFWRAGILTNGTLKIVLADGTTNSIVAYGDVGNYIAGIYSYHDLIVEGTGVLDVMVIGADPGEEAYGLYAGQYLTIRSGVIDVDVTAGQENAYGMYSSTQALEISGGTVTVTSSHEALVAPGRLEVSGGTVHATSSERDALYTNTDLIISGGEVVATGDRYGLAAYSGLGTVSIYGGRLVAAGRTGQAIASAGAVTLDMWSYKHKTNTDPVDLGSTYTLYPDTAFVPSSEYKYVDIMECPDVYVGGVEVSRITAASNTSYWLNSGGTITSSGAGPANYNAKYNEAIHTLSLRGLDISNLYNEAGQLYGIFAVDSLNLVFESGSVSSVAADSNIANTNGVGVLDNLRISGGGTLMVEVSSDADVCTGILCEGNLVVGDATVSITVRRVESATGIYCGENITMDGGTVAIGADGVDGVTAIRCRDDLTITGGTIDADLTGASYGTGVFAMENLFATGGSIDVRGGDACIVVYDTTVVSGGDISVETYLRNETYGFDVRDLVISGGTVNATGNTVGIRSDNSLTITGGSVTATALSDADSEPDKQGMQCSNGVITISGGIVAASGYHGGISGSRGVAISGGNTVASSAGSGIWAGFLEGMTISGGAVTTSGGWQALYVDGGETATVTVPAYKYRVNTDDSIPPEVGYTFFSETSDPTDAFVHSTDPRYLYVEIAATHAITKETPTNGAFTVSASSQEVSAGALGDTVTLASTPASGYRFSSWNVYRTGYSGVRVTVSGNSFTMPAYPVTVEATFAAIPPPQDDDEPMRTITVTETSSPLFSGTPGQVRAQANVMNAFATSVEVKVTDTGEDSSTFGFGVGSEVYPFDISLYIRGTNTKTQPRDGYSVTISLPIPEDLLGRKEQLSVFHKSGSGAVTTLQSRLTQIDGVWYLVFDAIEFSPYALVVSNPSVHGGVMGSYDQSAGVPYYLNAGPDVGGETSGNGNETFIGFAASGKYIAPQGVMVLVRPNPKTFEDVRGHWAEGYVGFVTQREVFLGTAPAIFSPDTGMTRAMFATVVGRLYERSFADIGASQVHAFTDCDYEDYYGKYVDWCAQNAIIQGVGVGLFEPDREITREEMAAILYRFADFLGVTPSGMDAVLGYPDAGSISSYAQAPALYCQTTGIITGRDGGTFAPQETASRAEVATIIERFVELVTR